MIFLIQYDRAKGEIVQMAHFAEGHRREAEDARLQLELRLHRSGTIHEVVLLEAADEDALRKTHSRYFNDWTTIARSTADATGEPTPRH